MIDDTLIETELTTFADIPEILWAKVSALGAVLFGFGILVGIYVFPGADLPGQLFRWFMFWWPFK